MACVEWMHASGSSSCTRPRLACCFASPRRSLLPACLRSRNAHVQSHRHPKPHTIIYQQMSAPASSAVAEQQAPARESMRTTRKKNAPVTPVPAPTAESASAASTEAQKVQRAKAPCFQFMEKGQSWDGAGVQHGTGSRTVRGVRLARHSSLLFRLCCSLWDQVRARLAPSVASRTTRRKLQRTRRRRRRAHADSSLEVRLIAHSHAAASRSRTLLAISNAMCNASTRAMA